LSLILSIVALILLVATGESETWMLFDVCLITIGITVGIFMISLAGLIVASIYSPLTNLGVQESGAWKSYAETLREIMREHEPISQPDLFELVLPYAASLGLAEAWTKFFQRRGEGQTPEWFQVLSSEHGESGMAAFTALIAASSAIGSSSAGSTAAGAAGGGASGAG
jgi:uncharacterized membrane protein